MFKLPESDKKWEVKLEMEEDCVLVKVRQGVDNWIMICWLD